MSIIKNLSIKNKLIIGLFTVALIIWGGSSLSRLPIDALPDITNNQVQIITVAPSQSALDIERLVTFPVEQTMSTIPGIQEIRSFSRFGLSVVTIVFNEGIEVYWATAKASGFADARHDWFDRADPMCQIAELIETSVRIRV